MGRGLSTKQNNYLAGNAIINAYLVKLGINGGSAKLFTTMPFDITYNGDVYEAQGKFLAMTEVAENSTLNIVNVTLNFTALDLQLVKDLCNSNQINQDVEIYTVFIDPTDNSLIGDSTGDKAILLFKGNITGYTVNSSTDTANITLDVSSQFLNFERTNGRRTNLGSFHKEFPEDYGFEFAHESLRDIKWGKP